MEPKKVVDLVPRPKAAPDADVVVLCRALLKQAEAGEILGVVCALDLAEGCTSSAMAFAHGVRPTALLGAVCMVRAKLERAILEDD